MSDNSGLIVDALERTAPALAVSIDARSSWRNSIKERAARVALYRNYERGDHRANMTNQMKKMLRLIDDDSGLSELNVNYCKVIVDKMAGRVFVSNIGVDTSAEEWLSETLERNDFDAQQSEWFRGAIRDGDAYVMIDPQSGAWIAEPAYDGFSGLEVIFDEVSRKPIWACKLWSEADTQDVNNGTNTIVMRMIVYQSDQISYWRGNENGGEVMADNVIEIENVPSETMENTPTVTNVMPWPLASGSLPIVHFANQQDSYTSYGESELRPAIPLQDSLNAIQHDKIMASKLTAFNIFWSIGFEIDVDGVLPGAVLNLTLKDESGNIITELTPEQVEFIKSARVGQFTGADITQYTNQVEKEVMQISQVTQTPIYGVTAQGNLSGEALKQLEVGLIGKVERFQHQNADAIKELIILTAEIQSTFDGMSAPPISAVRIIWKTPELLDVNARIATLVTLREKAPNLFADEFYIKRIGVLLGMSQDDIQKEIEASANQSSNFFANLVGAGAGIPVA